MFSGNPAAREECRAALSNLFCTSVYFKISELRAGCKPTDNSEGHIFSTKFYITISVTGTIDVTAVKILIFLGVAVLYKRMEVRL
jgi:hypothetical protein